MRGDGSTTGYTFFSSSNLRRLFPGRKLKTCYWNRTIQTVRSQSFASHFQHLALGLCCAVSLGPLGSLRAATYFLEGDAIGVDSSATDNTGGFTAVEEYGENLGQPGISVSLSGYELLEELRVIVFGVPASNGNLLFDKFQYKLKLWDISDYYAGADPKYGVDLGEPVGIELVANEPAQIMPSVPFGTTGIAGSGVTTFDFRFDLTNLPVGGTSQDLFSNPLQPGNWVIGFQSSHDTSVSGSLRVTGSVATEGPLPLFSRDDSVPRGVLGGQDPDNISIRWGITLGAKSIYPADFDHDFDVDNDDGEIWAMNFGNGPIGDADGDGDTDGADFLSWQGNFGTIVAEGSSVPTYIVPEPVSLVLILIGFIGCLSSRLTLRQDVRGANSAR